VGGITIRHSGGSRNPGIIDAGRVRHEAPSPNDRHFARASFAPFLDEYHSLCHDAHMYFEILDEITQVETFAIGSSIREIARLRKLYGKGRWRKRKGIAKVKLSDGSVHVAEIHWYEATGIGKKEFKIKRFLESLS